jgi:hypothetical protein
MKKIGIVIPWDTAFIWTAPAFNMLNWQRPEGYELNFIRGVGWCPAARHNDGVEKALEWGSDLVMFNGPDHLCPKDILPRMLQRISEGWDMVQAMVPSRGVCGIGGNPFHAMSYKIVGDMPKDLPMLTADAKSIKVITYADEPQQSHVCGTGNILMKAEIFDGLQKPYFEESIKKDNKYGRYAVQDSTFVYGCTILGGARLFCDTSIKLVHIDAFGIDETYQERFKDKKGQMDWMPAKDLREFE